MKPTNIFHRASPKMIWAAMAAVIFALALAGPQAAFADDKGKGKDGKVPIVIKKPIVTQDPPKKK